MGRSLVPCWPLAALLRYAWPDPLCRGTDGICGGRLQLVYLFVLLASLHQVLVVPAAALASSSFSLGPQTPKTSHHCHYEPASGGPPTILALIKGSPLWLASLLSFQQLQHEPEGRLPGSFHELRTKPVLLTLTVWCPQVITRGS